uniref:Alpha-carbonic anhydrase domain-containing protein n=1 Tax=viral metagenome TaxID=1070528 RepID=A0A6C0AJF7_9ZZZZ
MSIYSSTGLNSQWTGNCNGPNQSPINLSQSFAKPCDVLCELVFDEAYTTTASVSVNAIGLVLTNQAGLGTCKFNGEGYTCNALVVNHPSHHTIENIQADAEVIAIFQNPTGKFLLVSSLVRVNPAPTPSSSFLNAFISYANKDTFTTVQLGSDWTMGMMVPTTGAYYVYDGTFPFPECNHVKWVVFNSMINMDATDFAMLTKNGPAGSRPLQPLGDREVYFNSADHLAGGVMPHDNKIYLRLRPAKGIKVGAGNDVKPVKSVPIADKKEDKNSVVAQIKDWLHGQVSTNGYIAMIDGALMILAIVIALYFAVYRHREFSSLMMLSPIAIGFGRWIRSFFISPTPNV